MIEVDARDDQSPENVAGLLDTVIYAGLSAATDSLELDEEWESHLGGDPEKVLDLNIHSPVLLSSLSDEQIAGIRVLIEKQPYC